MVNRICYFHGEKGNEIWDYLKITRLMHGRSWKEI